MDSLIGTFHINFQAIIFQMINFTIVFVILYFVALKPILKILDSRSEKIKKGLEDSNRYSFLVKESEEVYKNELERARKDAFVLIQEAKKEAEIQKESIIIEAHGKVERLLNEGKSELERERDGIIKEAKEQMAHVVVDAAEKALDDVFSGEGSLDKQLIEKRIHDHHAN
jgi:F-type H+-transporting ATPase subunit b